MNVPERSRPNRKFVPTHTSAAPIQSTSTVSTNSSGSQRDSSRREADDGHRIETGALERLELLIERHQERRRLVGAQHAGRMRIEDHRDRRAATLASLAAHFVDELLVPAMETIEVAERDDRMRPAGALIVRERYDLHREHGTTGFQVPGSGSGSTFRVQVLVASNPGTLNLEPWNRYVTSITSPSYASAMPGGSSADVAA